MHLSYILIASGIFLQGLIRPSAGAAQTIEQSEFEELIYYWKYAVSAYEDICNKPNGQELIPPPLNTKFEIKYKEDNKDKVKKGDTQGYIARDKNKNAIIVAFRGTDSTYDMAVTNLAGIVAVDYVINGTAGGKPFTTNFGNSKPKIHGGFLTAYNVVSQFVFDTVQAQLQDEKNKGYSVVVVGHSLGGALASISAMTLQSNLPSGTQVNLYTFGQPRTGNVPYAKWVNGRINQNTFNAIRVTHQGDIVTVIPPAEVPGSQFGTGYVHHGQEYFQINGSASASNIKKCQPKINEYEDLSCQAGNPLRANGVKPHSNYLGIDTTQFFCT